MMRLRLRILRNELPPANTLWPVSDTQQSQTIAQLLEAVNKTFPLDASNWGLEDYIVTIGGYEALHYHELRAVCKDEDEVVVRPRTYAEVRARTLTGRAQITPDGRKLADGIAYGRPALRLVRPQITIPPKKLKRTLDEAAEEQDTSDKRVRFSPSDEEEQQGYIEGPPLGNHETQLPLDDEDDSDDESDEDFALRDQARAEGVKSIPSSDDSSEASSCEELSSDSSSEDSSDSDSSSDSSSSDSSSDESSDDSNDEPLWNGTKSSTPTTPQPKGTARSKKSTSRSSKQLMNGTSAEPSKRNAPTNGQADTGVNQVQRSSAGTSLPHEGKNGTKYRNNRRRESKALKYFKAQGSLHSTATMSDLQDYKDGNYVRPNNSVTTAESTPVNPELNATDSVPTSVQDQAQVSSGADEQAELEAKRQQLLAAIASGGVEIGHVKRRLEEDDEDGAPEELSSKRVDTGASVIAAIDKAVPSNDPSENQASRPKRLSAAHRMIYGGLGVRAPKDEEQRAALRKTLAGRRGPAAKAAAELIAEAEPSPALDPMQHFPEDEVDPNWWKAKINLMAIECVDEGVTLSAPSFPLVNGWDPQYEKKYKVDKKKERDSTVYQEKRKGKKKHADAAENYQLHGDGGDYLNYDDDDDENWKEGALLGDEEEEEEEEYYDPAAQQLQDEASNIAQPVDFPELPKDIATLPLLTEENAKNEDIITYSLLDCSAITNWQPKMLSRTVQLIGKDYDGWKVRVALRDVPPKEYDGNGKRVYSKFEEIDLNDKDPENEEQEWVDVGDERFAVLQWQDMGEVRLLLRDKAAA